MCDGNEIAASVPWSRLAISFPPAASNFAASAAEIGRRFRKPFISSPTMCSLSAALPPLPQTSSFRPFWYAAFRASNASPRSFSPPARSGWRAKSAEKRVLTRPLFCVAAGPSNQPSHHDGEEGERDDHFGPEEGNEIAQGADRR